MPSLAVDLVAQTGRLSQVWQTGTPDGSVGRAFAGGDPSRVRERLRTQQEDFQQQQQQQELGRRERAAEEARQQLERREAELKRKVDEGSCGDRHVKGRSLRRLGSL